jgi:hypothetical protein
MSLYRDIGRMVARKSDVFNNSVESFCLFKILALTLDTHDHRGRPRVIFSSSGGLLSIPSMI